MAIMSLELDIKNIGFSDKEAKVYLALLELGEAPVQQIAEKAGVNRATTYVILESLMKRGVASKVEKGKKTYFAAENPAALLRLFRMQEKEIQEKAGEFKRTLPELEALYNLAEEKPRVRYFEGKDGLLAMQEDFLTSGVKKLFAIYSADELDTIFTEEERKHYIERRQAQGISVRSIYTKIGGPYRSPTPAERKFVPKEQFPFSSDITIYGNRVAIATLRGKLISVIIESKEIADTLRLIFELAWSGAGKTAQEK